MYTIGVIEMLTEFTARHFYDKLLKVLGGSARHKADIIKKGYGYAGSVADFRKILSEVGIDEKKFTEEVFELIGEDKDKFLSGLVELLEKKTGKSSFYFYNRIGEIINKHTLGEKFPLSQTFHINKKTAGLL